MNNHEAICLLKLTAKQPEVQDAVLQVGSRIKDLESFVERVAYGDINSIGVAVIEARKLVNP